MQYVAEQEHVDAEWLRNEISKGTIVIPANINHKKLKPIGIGKGLRTKINANIGASKIRASISEELKKLERTVSDLESGELSLDDSLKRYEEGVKLAQFCSKKLETARRKVEILVKTSGGKLEAKPFDEKALEE